MTEQEEDFIRRIAKCRDLAKRMQSVGLRGLAGRCASWLFTCSQSTPQQSAEVAEVFRSVLTRDSETPERDRR